MDVDLKQVRDLIASGWCQKCNARLPDGYPATPWERDACQWCLAGAIIKVIGRDTQLKSMLFTATKRLGFRSVSEMMDWNDAEGRTQAQVLDRIDAVIA